MRPWLFSVLCRLPTPADILLHEGMCENCQTGLMRCSKIRSYSINQPVGESEQSRWNGQGKRSRRGEIDDQLESGWLLHR